MAENEESFFIVSSEIVESSIGFTLDAGGSATKVLYRSKRDYCKGKPINKNIPEGKGILRMESITVTCNDDVIPFIEKECDVNVDLPHKDVYCTGLHIVPYEKLLKERFGLGLHRDYEIDFMMTAIRYQLEHCLTEEPFYADEPEAEEMAKEELKFYTFIKEVINQRKGLGSAFRWTDVSEDDAGKIEKTSADQTAVKPFIVGLLGSCIVHYKVECDWSYDLLDWFKLGGRPFMGVANMICQKCETFDEVMRLAAEGNSDNVDVSASETRMETDIDEIYGATPDDTTFFLFGKAAVTDPSKFSKADLMASWLNANCAIFAQNSHYVALQHGLENVVVVGGFAKYPLTRMLLTKYFNARALQAKGKMVRLRFLKNGQYMNTLGAYLQEGRDRKHM